LPECSSSCQRSRSTSWSSSQVKVLGVACIDAADVDEHDRVEAELVEDVVRARHRVGARVVEGEQQRASRQLDLLAVHEVDERLQVDRLVAGVVDHPHLLGEVVGIDAVGGVGGVREVALGRDPVVEEHRDRRAVRRERRPHLLLLGRQRASARTADQRGEEHG
jgi:hypothetical protein